MELTKLYVVYNPQLEEMISVDKVDSSILILLDPCVHYLLTHVLRLYYVSVVVLSALSDLILKTI